MTLLDVLYAYIDSQSHLKPSTIHRYRYDARLVVRAHGGDERIGRVNWGRIIANLDRDVNDNAWYLTFRVLTWMGH